MVRFAKNVIPRKRSQSSRSTFSQLSRRLVIQPSRLILVEAGARKQSKQVVRLKRGVQSASVFAFTFEKAVRQGSAQYVTMARTGKPASFSRPFKKLSS